MKPGTVLTNGWGYSSKCHGLSPPGTYSPGLLVTLQEPMAQALQFSFTEEAPPCPDYKGAKGEDGAFSFQRLPFLK